MLMYIVVVCQQMYVILSVMRAISVLSHPPLPVILLLPSFLSPFPLPPSPSLSPAFTPHLTAPALSLSLATRGSKQKEGQVSWLTSLLLRSRPLQ